MPDNNVIRYSFAQSASKGFDVLGGVGVGDHIATLVMKSLTMYCPVYFSDPKAEASAYALVVLISSAVFKVVLDWLRNKHILELIETASNSDAPLPAETVTKLVN